MLNEKYASILHLPHHVSKVHPQLSMEQRAAQFSPFQALTGYEDEIEETERLTLEKEELTEEVLADLSHKFNILRSQLETYKEAAAARRQSQEAPLQPLVKATPQQSAAAALQPPTAAAAQPPTAAITWFIPDNKKSGGSYQTAAGTIIKIRDFEKQIELKAEDGSVLSIPIDEISDIRLSK